MVLMGFERWNDILKLARPDPSLIYTTAQWHFARALALAGLKKPEEAQTESKLFYAELAKLPRDASFDPLNSVTDIARVQENFLAAAIKQGEHGRGEEGEVIEALE